MNITTAALDLAKIVFQVHGVDERGNAKLRKQLKRAQVMGFFTNLPPCLIGMEACASAHFWARKLTELGHTVKLMAPQFVKPYPPAASAQIARPTRAQADPPRGPVRFFRAKRSWQRAGAPRGRRRCRTSRRQVAVARVGALLG